MKMAERQNILAMGLEPRRGHLIWRRLGQPRGARRRSAQAYQAIVADPELFHQSGAYTATLGDLACREQIARFEAHLFGVPRLGPEHIAIGVGSTPAHPRPVPHAGRSGRHGDAARPDLRQLRGPAGVRGAGRARSSGCRCSTRRRGPIGRSPIPRASPATSSRLFDQHRPKLVLFGAPDNPTSQVVPQALAELMLERTAAAGSWLAIDFAYKCQCFETPPAYYALVAGRPSQPRRHPLELEVGARPGPPARLD